MIRQARQMIPNVTEGMGFLDMLYCSASVSLIWLCSKAHFNRPGGVCAKAIQWSWGLQLAHWLEMNLMNPMIRKQQRISIFAIFIQLMYCLSVPIYCGEPLSYDNDTSTRADCLALKFCFEIGGGIPESSKLSHVPSIFMCTRYEMTCRDFIWRLPPQPWSLALRLGT